MYGALCVAGSVMMLECSRFVRLSFQSYRSVQAIIYVLDSGDQLRLVVAKDEFQRLLKHKGRSTGTVVDLTEVP